MKAILILEEMPNSCSKCPCFNREDGFCQTDKKERRHDGTARPYWCLLKNMPQRVTKLNPNEHDYLEGMYNGWNSCINYIEERQELSEITG